MLHPVLSRLLIDSLLNFLFLAVGLERFGSSHYKRADRSKLYYDDEYDEYDEYEEYDEDDYKDSRRKGRGGRRVESDVRQDLVIFT